MIRLMVVDDEYFVRRGVIDSIEWGAYDIEVCGEAASGEEALEHIPQLSPDIMLVDIRMSGMDGLTLVATLAASHPAIKCIILSGHGEFAYAQKAIVLGVSEYLLKPIGAEELVRSVLRVKGQLDMASQKNADYDAINRNTPLLPWNVERKPLPMDTSFFRVFLFTLDDVTNRTRFGLASRADILLECKRCAEEHLQAQHLNYILTTKYQELFIVMLNYEQQGAPISLIIEGLCKQLLEDGLIISVGYGKEVQGYRQISTAYNSAFAALSGRLSHPPGAILSADTASQQLQRPYFYNSDIDCRFKQELAICQAFGQCDPSFADLVGQLVDDTYAAGNLEAAITAGLRIGIVCSCLLNSGELNAGARQALGSQLHQPNLSCQPAFRQWLHLLCCQLLEAATAERNSKYRSTVERVLEYIKEHYSENISLNMISELVYVTPNYLSKIFKEATGTNFKDWLIAYRIERSKELLLNPTVKMYEVSQRVGYTEYKHFAKLFKRITGVSATDFRARCK